MFKYLKEILEVRGFIIHNSEFHNGGLAQLARALALHARGHRFDSDILHQAISGDNLVYL